MALSEQGATVRPSGCRTSSWTKSLPLASRARRSAVASCGTARPPYARGSTGCPAGRLGRPSLVDRVALYLAEMPRAQPRTRHSRRLREAEGDDHAGIRFVAIRSISVVIGLVRRRTIALSRSFPVTSHFGVPALRPARDDDFLRRRALNYQWRASGIPYSGTSDELFARDRAARGHMARTRREDAPTAGSEITMSHTAAAMKGRPSCQPRTCASAQPRCPGRGEAWRYSTPLAATRSGLAPAAAVAGAWNSSTGSRTPWNRSLKRHSGTSPVGVNPSSCTKRWRSTGPPAS
jgi:hypothetical protein